MKRLICAMFLVTAMIACGDDSNSPVSPSGGVGGSTASSSNHPPGQHPSGNPAHAPGCSNPNPTPSSDCKSDDK